MEHKVWYLGVRGERKGPWSEEDILAMVHRGEVAPADLVWKEGMDSWKPVIVAMIHRGEVAPADLVSKEGMDSPKPVNEVEPFKESMVSHERQDPAGVVSIERVNSARSRAEAVPRKALLPTLLIAFFFLGGCGVQCARSFVVHMTAGPKEDPREDELFRESMGYLLFSSWVFASYYVGSSKVLRVLENRREGFLRSLLLLLCGALCGLNAGVCAAEFLRWSLAVNHDFWGASMAAILFAQFMMIFWWAEWRYDGCILVAHEHERAKQGVAACIEEVVDASGRSYKFLIGEYDLSYEDYAACCRNRGIPLLPNDEFQLVSQAERKARVGERAKQGVAICMEQVVDASGSSEKLFLGEYDLSYEDYAACCRHRGIPFLPDDEFQQVSKAEREAREDKSFEDFIAANWSGRTKAVKSHRDFVLWCWDCKRFSMLPARFSTKVRRQKVTFAEEGIRAFLGYRGGRVDRIQPRYGEYVTWCRANGWCIFTESDYVPVADIVINPTEEVWVGPSSHWSDCGNCHGKGVIHLEPRPGVWAWRTGPEGRQSEVWIPGNRGGSSTCGVCGGSGGSRYSLGPVQVTTDRKLDYSTLSEPAWP